MDVSSLNAGGGRTLHLMESDMTIQKQDCSRSQSESFSYHPMRSRHGRIYDRH